MNSECREKCHLNHHQCVASPVCDT
uniref:Uncharacterized protein n=1 Tax=Anguilla anguilla TaxID=7936 RepID=A0A0E9RHS9_ANGAN